MRSEMGQTRSSFFIRRHSIIFIIVFSIIAILFIVKSSTSTVPSIISLLNVATTASAKDNISIEWLPRNPPVLDFFIRTCRGDGHWLIYLLRSIEKYVPHTLYRDIIITFSSTETAYFQSYLPFFPLPIKLIPMTDIFIRGGRNNGSYYSQMYAKFYAYRHSDADFFIHMDSDTIFNQPIRRLDLLDEQNRVYVQRVKFSELPQNFRAWQKVAEKLLLESVPYETMTGFPFVYPRDLYQNTIRLIEKRHKKSMLEVARSVQDFIEFTTLGHYLITYMSNRWIDNDNKSAKVFQSWSWGGFGPNEVAWYECILRAKNHKMCHFQSSVKANATMQKHLT
jgi:hypothetical protein